MSADDVLKVPMGENDSGEKDVRSYLKALLKTLWNKQEGFSGKRPFGNSGWDFDLYKALIESGHISGVLDSDGYVEKINDKNAAHQVVLQAIEDL